MRIAAPPRHDTAPLDAFVASMRVWLPAVRLWIAYALAVVEPLARRSPFVAAWLASAKARVAADMRRTASCLRAYLMCSAFVSLRTVPRARHCGVAAGASSASRRLRRAATSGMLRNIHRGSLRERAERLKRLFADRAALIARAAAQLCALYRAGPKSRAPIASAASASLSPAPLSASLSADTS